ncbi:CPBP family intramembrane metalloprotease [Microbulbifer sp. OS29]|uniref:CPBP family intramembrane metalloprotease n=1 Tax=Microbulbifer okhotskensis TaxID=2926617 RepID=A0A9X2J306_9GAMM|nr:CPBP family intramembrane glutamic endopeptidase [Microbulbifer okhotskensis]MCO1333042.1 CPBP family intramembrane metalloprotease [Microbulbifer okhotskensis]
MRNGVVDKQADQYPGQVRKISPWAAPLLLLLCIIPFGWTGLVAPLTWIALVAIESSSGWKRALSFVSVAVLMLVTGLNFLPGGEHIQITAPYSDADGNLVYANLNGGKAVIAIALLAFMLRLRQSFRFSDLPFLLLAISLPILVGLFIYPLSLKFSWAILIYALINLLVVCISEEGFFRWILQRGAGEVLGGWRWLSVPMVACIFVLLHGGRSTDIAAFLLLGFASLSYALLWYLRQNFWICVFAHWGVNLLHILLLPYPLPG